MPESLKRRRARFAYDRVRDWSGRSAREAAARAKGLPIQLRTQGLGTVVAILADQASGRDDADLLGRLLADWLLSECPRQPFGDRVDVDGARSSRELRERLLDACYQSNRAAYAAAQAEGLALLEEVKILAQALHGGE